MSENRTGKYLKYAFGEILLVMIGILLALQVNNWSEQHKLDKQTKEYEERLINDIIIDTIAIHNSLPIRRRTIKNIEAYFERFDTTKTGLKMALDEAILVQTGLARYVPVRNTFDDLKSTGNFNLLTMKKQGALSKLAHRQDLQVIKDEKMMENYYESAILAEGFIERRIMSYANKNDTVIKTSGLPYKSIYDIFEIQEDRTRLAQGLIYRQNMLVSLRVYHTIALRDNLEILALSKKTIEVLKSND